MQAKIGRELEEEEAEITSFQVPTRQDEENSEKIIGAEVLLLSTKPDWATNFWEPERAMAIWGNFIFYYSP